MNACLYVREIASVLVRTCVRLLVCVYVVVRATLSEYLCVCGRAWSHWCGSAWIKVPAGVNRDWAGVGQSMREYWQVWEKINIGCGTVWTHSTYINVLMHGLVWEKERLSMNQCVYRCGAKSMQREFRVYTGVPQGIGRLMI